MKKYAVVLAAAVLFIFASQVIVFSNDIVWDDISRGNLNLKTVLVNPDNPRFIYTGSSNGVFKSEDGGENWRSVFSTRGSNREVNFLAFAPGNRNSLYAATGNGLYFSSNAGRNWSGLFKGKNYLENECAALAVLPSAIYLGTKAGLFVSKDRGRSWQRQSGEIGKTSILALAYNFKEPNSIYAACIDGAFKTRDSGQSWEKIFVASPTENGNDGEEITEDQDEAERYSNIRYIAADPNNLNYLYLATSRGLYITQDKGRNWEPFSSFGLLSREVRFLSVSPESNLYVVTKSGIFEYKDNRWQELSLGLTAEDIRFLAQDNQDNLYAACDKGLFKTKRRPVRRIQDNIIATYYKDEPGIKEVQQAAIRYAEVEPEKILRWRKQAAKRAWLPKVTVDMDRDMDRTASNTIWGIYPSYNGGTISAPGRYFVGPDDITKYNNKNWGISLTWDLGDLIWNDAQTSIDVRSRLMVQLRDDVLDEVTRLYFERIHFKIELDNLSIEERRKRLEKELKLEELTAHLNGLTGGYFSQQLNSKSQPPAIEH